jgi:hypothetical protein
MTRIRFGWVLRTSALAAVCLAAIPLQLGCPDTKGGDPTPTQTSVTSKVGLRSSGAGAPKCTLDAAVRWTPTSGSAVRQPANGFDHFEVTSHRVGDADYCDFETDAVAALTAGSWTIEWISPQGVIASCGAQLVGGTNWAAFHPPLAPPCKTTTGIAGFDYP